MSHPLVADPPPASAQSIRELADGACELEALRALRVAFIKEGPSRGATPTGRADAWRVAYWTLYELGHVLDELERRAADGTEPRAFVSAVEPSPGRVVIEIRIEPRVPPAPGAVVA